MSSGNRRRDTALDCRDVHKLYVRKVFLMVAIVKWRSGLPTEITFLDIFKDRKCLLGQI